MTFSSIHLIALHFFKKTCKTSGFKAIYLIMFSILVYVTVVGVYKFEDEHHIREHHQEKARDSWEDNPDKHPHRMAHFGTFAFRQQHPLSIINSGINSFTGNAIFLEAHKQNTANFSEASLTSSMIRFGNLNLAVIIQLLIPLLLFFIGYNAIVGEKENSTLKVMYLQGANFPTIFTGKLIGLFYVGLLFIIPALLMMWCIFLVDDIMLTFDIILRILTLQIAYIVFIAIICFITIFISAISKNSNKALLSLLGIWLLFFIVIPKTGQVVGNYLYPNLSKIAFKAAIEEEVSKKGDSHNAKDPYFNRIKDSILNVHNVSSVNELPFNYQGFLMQKGEEQSATTYKKHHNNLIKTYEKQNSITTILSVINPYLAIKNIAMGIAGSDFDNYVSFLNQAEDYRYKQSQYLNQLQMKYISNSAKSSEGKVHVVNKDLWKSFPDFTYNYPTLFNVLSNQVLAIIGMILWLIIALAVTVKYSHRFKII